MPQFSSGEVFGEWALEEFLGAGGNAEVWTAVTSDRETVALKVLKSRRVNSEPYARFRQEILALQRINQQIGVLPILDHDLPETLSRHQHAWLAMPVAVPLADAIRESSLHDIVSAVAGNRPEPERDY